MVAWYKFNKYYTLSDNTATHVVAALLYPQLREVYLRKVWLSKEQQKWIKPTITKVRNLQKDNFKPDNIQLIDLNLIQDPAKRFLTEMTISTIIADEFNDFIKVSNISNNHLSLQLTSTGHTNSYQ